MTTMYAMNERQTTTLIVTLMAIYFVAFLAALLVLSISAVAVAAIFAGLALLTVVAAELTVRFHRRGGSGSANSRDSVNASR